MVFGNRFGAILALEGILFWGYLQQVMNGGRQTQRLAICHVYVHWNSLYYMQVTNVFSVFLQGHLRREKKAFRYAPPPCLKQWEIMFEKSHVSGQSACIPGEEGGGDSVPNEEERDDDPIQEIGSEQFTPTSSTRTVLKRKVTSGSPRKISPRKKGKNPMVRVMSRMVDDVISSNSVTSKALTGDFTRESVREVMALVKECGAVEGSDEHYIATQLFKHSANREIFFV